MIRRLLLALVLSCTFMYAPAQAAGPLQPCATVTLALCGPTTALNGTPIVAAATTVLIAGVQGQRIYVDYLAALTTGTNATDTVNWEWSLVANCASANTLLFTTPLALGTSVGLLTTGWSDVPQAGTAIAGWSPAAKALIIPVGANLCFVTAGTTIAVQPVTFASQY